MCAGCAPGGGKRSLRSFHAWSPPLKRSSTGKLSFTPIPIATVYQCARGHRLSSSHPCLQTNISITKLAKQDRHNVLRRGPHPPSGLYSIEMHGFASGLARTRGQRMGEARTSPAAATPSKIPRTEGAREGNAPHYNDADVCPVGLYNGVISVVWVSPSCAQEWRKKGLDLQGRPAQTLFQGGLPGHYGWQLLLSAVGRARKVMLAGANWSSPALTAAPFNSGRESSAANLRSAPFNCTCLSVNARAVSA